MNKRPIMHVDIPTADRAATAHFYSTIFGWEVGPTDASTVYTTFSSANMSGGFPNLHGGFLPVTEHMQAGNVVLYLPSEDIDADLRQIEALGGTVVLPKTLVAEQTWVALFRDPNGATLALASNKQ